MNILKAKREPNRANLLLSGNTNRCKVVSRIRKIEILGFRRSNSMLDAIFTDSDTETRTGLAHEPRKGAFSFWSLYDHHFKRRIKHRQHELHHRWLATFGQLPTQSLRHFRISRIIRQIVVFRRVDLMIVQLRT